jgi:hypothetical protein
MSNLIGKQITGGGFSGKCFRVEGTVAHITDSSEADEIIPFDEIETVNGKPAKFKVWTSIELNVDDEDVYVDITADTVSIGEFNSYEEANEHCQELSNTYKS